MIRETVKRDPLLPGYLALLLATLFPLVVDTGWARIVALGLALASIMLVKLSTRKFQEKILEYTRATSYRAWNQGYMTSREDLRRAFITKAPVAFTTNPYTQVKDKP